MRRQVLPTEPSPTTTSFTATGYQAIKYDIEYTDVVVLIVVFKSDDVNDGYFISKRYISFGEQVKVMQVS